MTRYNLASRLRRVLGQDPRDVVEVIGALQGLTEQTVMLGARADPNRFASVAERLAS